MGCFVGREREREKGKKKKKRKSEKGWLGLWRGREKERGGFKTSAYVGALLPVCMYWYARRSRSLRSGQDPNRHQHIKARITEMIPFTQRHETEQSVRRLQRWSVLSVSTHLWMWRAPSSGSLSWQTAGGRRACAWLFVGHGTGSRLFWIRYRRNRVFLNEELSTAGQRRDALRPQLHPAAPQRDSVLGERLRGRFEV